MRGAFLLLVVLAIACLVASKMTRTLQARASARLRLPRELRHAQLAFAEKTFRTSQPIGLIARADRGYRLKGQVHLIEFKTRTFATAYSADVIELSAQTGRHRGEHNRAGERNWLRASSGSVDQAPVGEQGAVAAGSRCHCRGETT
jgi:hypothetical protein